MEDDGATVGLSPDQLRDANVAFVGEAAVEALFQGDVHRLFTGLVERVTISDERATIEIGGNHLPLSETQVGGLVIGAGSNGPEMIANVLRAFGMPSDRMQIEGWTPGPREVFLVASPVDGITVTQDTSVGGVTFTSTNPARLGLPEADETVQKYLSSAAWVYTTVDADTVFDAEVAGLERLDLGVSLVRAFGAYSFPVLDDRLREFDRQHTRARIRKSDLVFVGSIEGPRRWLRVVSDPTLLPDLPLQEVIPASSLEPQFSADLDADLARALREWRVAIDSDDDFARVTHLWRSVECYAKRGKPPTLFSDEELKSALRGATSAGAWTNEQAARIRATLGSVNDRPLLSKLRFTLEGDQIEMPDEQFEALKSTRSFRNSIEHGRALSPLQHQAVDKALAIMNRVLVTAFLKST
jgi:hypothetical protein